MRSTLNSKITFVTFGIVSIVLYRFQMPFTKKNQENRNHSKNNHVK